jgi:hypothetical protein
MSIDSTREYLSVKQRQYATASRKERTHILDEIVAVTGLDRKYLIQLLGGDLRRKPRQRQRGRTYGPDVEAALLVVAETLDYICGKRLQPELLSVAQDLERHRELVLSPKVKESLGKISAATIDRILAPHRKHIEKRLPRKSPARPTRVQRAVPMQIINWDEREPGHLETDLVFHCGPTTSGDFVYSLQMIDVATGWSERLALLGKGGMVMQDAFRVARHRLPFAIKEIHFDNGVEFLNEHMLRLWPALVPGVRLSRNRPWCKNDSRFVEQKNFTLVRAYLGYGRYDAVAQTRAINYLYELMGLYYNLFQPVMRLQEKTRVLIDGQSVIKRRYDTPKTPFQRLCHTKVLDDSQKAALNQLRQAINPRQLRREILDLIKEIKSMPNAKPGEVHSVFDTLSCYRPYLTKGDWDVRVDLHLTQPLPLTLTNDSLLG